jgi:energy-coupling factor transporter ATP-binding protein EcfA2
MFGSRRLNLAEKNTVRLLTWFARPRSFSFFSVDQDLSSQVGRSRVANLLRCIVPDVPDEFASSLSTFSMQMQQMNADPLSSVHSPVSLRQMLRMARRVVHYPHEAHSSLSNANMIKYMPKAEREACLAMMADAGIQRYDEEYSVESVSVIVTDKDGLQTDDYSRGAVLRIGDVETPCALPNNRALVPDVLFYQIPMHTRLLRSLLQDFLIGEHLLLIGNQGVGKNKLTDRLLQLMRREREYIQLHRDTTVQALTLTPTLVNGRVVWEDSPLVKALVNGRVLVIDEADKAPTEVVCVLKGLLEDGEILFADGRRFVSSRSPVISAIGEANLPPDICSIHPDFRVIALANRPGYPFLGNDFFSEMGDVFAVYSIDNPDQQSEIEMLQAYSDGAVPLGMLYKLTSAFKDLRQLTEDGVLSYPYSTRELVNVVQHLTRFPDDNITQVLENCFAFDSFDVELRQSLYSTFQRHGIPLGSNDGMGIRNSLALAHKLGPPVPTSILQQLEESVELPVARAPLVEDWKRGLGRKAGWSPAQLHTMDDKMSGRVSRFSEEVGGFSLVGNDEPCDDGIVSLADGSVAVLTQTNELQIASPEFSTIKTIAINNGAPEVFASVSSPPLVAAKSLGKLITFNTLREILVIVDPETGAAVPFACPLDAPDSGLIDAAAGGSAAAGSASNRSAFTNDRLFFGRMDVGLMDGFEIAGGCILYRDGGSVLAFVHYDTTTGLWQCTKVTLPATIRIKSVQALFSQRFLLRCSKHVWTLTLNSGLHSVSSARLTRWSEQPHATAAAHTSLEEFIFLSRPYPAVPSVRGQQHLFSAPDILAGYSTGFSEDSDDASPVTMWSFERDATQLEPPDTPPIMRRRYVGCEVSSRAGSVVCISNPQALTLEVVDMETRQLRQIHLGFQVGQPPPPPPKAEIQNQAILPKRTEKHPTVVGITETLDGTVFLLQRNGTVRLIDINTDRVREEESEWQSMIQGTADRTLERSLPFENEAVSAGAAEGADVLEIDFKRHIRWIHHQMRELNA